MEKAINGSARTHDTRTISGGVCDVAVRTASDVVVLTRKEMVRKPESMIAAINGELREASERDGMPAYSHLFA